MGRVANGEVGEPGSADLIARDFFGAELTRRGVTYSELVGKLADIGVMDSEPNISNKISRGKFTAVFLVQCLTAIGVSEIRL